ncbi:MAG: nitroreductase family protein [Fibrobacterota bacterium]
MIDILRARRSVRFYEKTPVEQEKIAILKEAALRAPTSRNRMAWKFWFITDKARLARLEGAKKAGSAPVSRASLAIVIGADSSKTDVWVEDCSIAAILLQLTAQSLGLGSCWVQIRNRTAADGSLSETYVRRELNITNEEIRMEAIISVGYPAETKTPIPAEKLPAEAIQEETD